MKTATRINLILFIFFFYGFFIYISAAKAQEGESDRVLSATESLFKAMEEKNYNNIWGFLTKKSKGIIIDDVSKEILKQKVQISSKQIEEDFDSSGPLAKAYWDSFLFQFDPKMVLEHSSWKLKLMEKQYAEVEILYKQSKLPAIIKVFQENGQWKIGLEESFRTRRWTFNQLF